MKHIRTTVGIDVSIDVYDPDECPPLLWAELQSYFDEWLSKQPEDTQEMYLGSLEELDGAPYLSCHGAIEDMYTALIEYMRESKKRRFSTQRDFPHVDFEGIIQP